MFLIKERIPKPLSGYNLLLTVKMSTFGLTIDTA